MASILNKTLKTVTVDNNADLYMYVYICVCVCVVFLMYNYIILGLNSHSHSHLHVAMHSQLHTISIWITLIDIQIYNSYFNLTFKIGALFFFIFEWSFFLFSVFGFLISAADMLAS